MSAVTIPYQKQPCQTQSVELGERITLLRALLDEHYEPGRPPSSYVQGIIDELDRLIASVMHERLTEWKYSSVGMGSISYQAPNQRSNTGGTS